MARTASKRRGTPKGFRRKRGKDPMSGVTEQVRRNRWPIAIGIVLGVLIFIATGTKLTLYGLFLIGNDVVVSLDVDQTSIALERGQTAIVSATAKVTTNPFCSAFCHETFEDLGAGETVDEKEFEIRPGNPYTMNYDVTARRDGTGQDIYRLSISCTGVKKSFLCETGARPTTRSVVISVMRSLNADDLAAKAQAHDALDARLRALGNISTRLDGLADGVIAFAAAAGEDEKLASSLADASLSLASLAAEAENALREWEAQRFDAVLTAVEDEDAAIDSLMSEIDSLASGLASLIGRRNAAVSKLISTRETLIGLAGRDYLSQSSVDLIAALSSRLQEAVDAARTPGGLAAQETAAEAAEAEAGLIAELLEGRILTQALTRLLDLDVSYDALCELTGSCFPHPGPDSRVVQGTFSLADVCEAVDELNARVEHLNRSLRAAYLAQAYPDDSLFWENLSSVVATTRNGIVRDYLLSVPTGIGNSAEVSAILRNMTYAPRNFTFPAPNASAPPAIDDEDGGNATGENATAGNGTPAYDPVPAYVSLIAQGLPARCTTISADAVPIPAVDLAPLDPPQTGSPTADPVLDEPEPVCCVFAECGPCCMAGECRDDPAAYPVVFFHGHAVNKDISLEYSLEGFNQIQDRLEEDGVLSMGTITLYTSDDSPYGEWGMPGVPVSIRATYYYDLFKEPENYIIVQTKSENIDTYAVRVAELLSKIERRTGRPKVHIIAHSMGGLVVRRYLQLFGTGRVADVILIGTPNTGIVDDVADICGLIGERKECEDMEAGSLFLNKLNREPLPDIPFTMISGTGCEMKGGPGDGIVLADRAYLDGATNIVINGTCRGSLAPLHTDLLDITRHPEVYGIIRERVLGLG
ncbi:alpha/beta fold hydrolase [Candidatus Woesearchaeota archaeon]|nr:alpha/beta fold hydrolase [Candidatus Woesearchaeota archaeon]